MIVSFRRALLSGASVLALACSVSAQRTSAPISAADLKTRLYLIADDSMGGRATGSKGNFQAAEYVAAEFRRLGLTPAGENGTYFQTVPFFRLRAANGSQLTAGGSTYRLGADYLVATTYSIPRPVDGKQIVYGGIAEDTATWISAEKARDRLVVLAAAAGPAGLRQLRALGRAARFSGAAALVLPVLEAVPPEFAAALLDGRVTTDTSRTRSDPGVILVNAAVAERLLGRPLAGAKPGTLGPVVHGSAVATFEPLPYPARNVVAVLPGSDPALAGTFVSVSAHNDHVGFDHHPVDHDSLHVLNGVTRPLGADTPPRAPTAAEWVVIRKSLDSLRKIRPARPDSIRNGADDDGSGTVVLLELAEELASRPHPKRSVLFVSHAAEEEGLLGSRWFTDNPTVARDSIVSEFDMDMVARGNKRDLPGGSPGYLEVIGMRRLSKEYGDLIEAANRRQPEPFEFNLTFDAPGHPLQYYCRADHYSYARYDIPSVSISRGEHMDYHQVTDEAQYADYDAMTRIGRFVLDVIGSIGNLDHRPKVDFAKHDPKAPCVQ